MCILSLYFKSEVLMLNLLLCFIGTHRVRLAVSGARAILGPLPGQFSPAL